MLWFELSSVRTRLFLSGFAGALGVAAAIASGLVASYPVLAMDREAEARALALPQLQTRFREAGLTYPARSVFLRVYKFERVLELWAHNDDKAPFRLIHAYPILAASGHAGPKLREGDEQVPEGVYQVVFFNPQSLYYLSLRLNYPNSSDLVRADRQHPGSDIYIHGNSVSIGCVAIGDAGISEVYTAARDASGPITVFLFPAKFTTENVEQLTAGQPEFTRLWQQLAAIDEFITTKQRLPMVRVTPEGDYVLEP
jgi:murein L,D-transpeptidase YafK